jgi:hypothetical protein
MLEDLLVVGGLRFLPMVVEVLVFCWVERRCTDRLFVAYFAALLFNCADVNARGSLITSHCGY